MRMIALKIKRVIEFREDLIDLPKKIKQRFGASDHEVFLKISMRNLNVS